MPTTPTAPIDDDELDELPPLDGESESENDSDPDYADMVDETATTGGAEGLDDTTGEDDPVDEELDTTGGGASEAGWLDEDADGEALDIGASDVSAFEGDAPPLDDHDEPGVGDEDYGFGEDDRRTDLDGGEEGPLVTDEAVSEADLPRLDADEEGDVDDSDVADPMFERDLETGEGRRSETGGVAWAPRRWAPVFAPSAIGHVTAIACGAHGVVAAVGASLVRVDVEGATEPIAAAGLTGEVIELAYNAAALIAVTRGGALFVSIDDGATFRNVASGVTAAALSLGVVFALKSEGVVRMSRDLGASWEDAPSHGPALAIAAREAGSFAAVSRNAMVREPSPPQALPSPLASSARPIAAARASFAACVDDAGAQILDASHDPPTFRAVAIEGGRAACFLDDAGTLLVAAYHEQEDASWLVCVDANGRALGVAAVGAGPDADEPDAQVTGLANDEARGVVWVGGGFGVIAFEVERSRI